MSLTDAGADERLIVVLGGMNDEGGRLHWAARDRCEEAVRQYRAQERVRVLPTGGHGEHFNRTGRPHWVYLRDHLVRAGVPLSDVLEGLPSKSTRDDAILCAALFRSRGLSAAVVVTSDFHVERAARLFRLAIPSVALCFVPARSTGPPHQLAELMEHERRSLEAGGPTSAESRW